MGRSCCILFLDLAKAFDYALRESLMGWPQDFNATSEQKSELGSWFRYGHRDSVIVTRKGGRQGCVFGGIVFNMTYAMALGQVRVELRKRSIILLLQYKGSKSILQGLC